MSLVVAYAAASGIRIVTDTRITYSGNPRTGHQHEELKAIIIGPNQTVCFAGDVATGNSGARMASALAADGVDCDRIAIALHESAMVSSTPVDYLLACTSTRPRLFRITASAIERDLSASWIGDKLAFERFQTARAAAVTRLPADLHSVVSDVERAGIVLRSAMDATIDDPEVTSVGGVALCVASSNTGFKYLGGVFVYLERDVQIADGGDLLQTMLLSPADGGYAICVVPGEAQNPSAVCLSFPTASLAFVFSPLQWRGAKIVTGISARNLRQEVYDRLGLMLEQPMLQ